MQKQRSRKSSVAGDPAAIKAVEAEILRIQTLKPDEVRALWPDTFEKKVPISALNQARRMER